MKILNNLILSGYSTSGTKPSILKPGEFATNLVDGNLFLGSSVSAVREFESKKDSTYFVQDTYCFLSGTNATSAIPYPNDGTNRLFLDFSAVTTGDYCVIDIPYLMSGEYEIVIAVDGRVNIFVTTDFDELGGWSGMTGAYNPAPTWPNGPSQNCFRINNGEEKRCKFSIGHNTSNTFQRVGLVQSTWAYLGSSRTTGSIDYDGYQYGEVFPYLNTDVPQLGLKYQSKRVNGIGEGYEWYNARDNVMFGTDTPTAANEMVQVEGDAYIHGMLKQNDDIVTTLNPITSSSVITQKINYSQTGTISFATDIMRNTIQVNGATVSGKSIVGQRTMVEVPASNVNAQPSTIGAIVGAVNIHSTPSSPITVQALQAVAGNISNYSNSNCTVALQTGLTTSSNTDTTSSCPVTTLRGINGTVTAAGTGAITTISALRTVANISNAGTAATVGTSQVIEANTTLSGTNNVTSFNNIVSSTTHSGSGSATTVCGGINNITLSGYGSITNGYIYNSNLTLSGSHNVSGGLFGNAFAIFVKPSNSPTIPNVWGVDAGAYIDNSSVGNPTINGLYGASFKAYNNKGGATATTVKGVEIITGCNVSGTAALFTTIYGLQVTNQVRGATVSNASVGVDIIGSKETTGSLPYWRGLQINSSGILGGTSTAGALGLTDIYQQNTSAYNIFLGKTLIGASSITSGNEQLQVSGTISSTTGILLGNSSNSNTNILDWYEEGSYSFTANGFASSPTGTIYFTRVGNIITLLIPIITGTSNATNFTITAGSTSMRPSAQRTVIGRVKDNGGSYVATVILINTDGTIQVLKDISATTLFTASGTKALDQITFSYLL